MLNLATIGTSWITQSFIDGAKKAGGINIIACYSRDIKKAESFASKNNARYYYNDLDLMADNAEIDAVYIASPNYLHYQQSKFFLSKGKNVIVEKPATTTLEENEELYKLAEENGLVFTEAIMSIHTPQFTLLKEETESAGRIRTVNLIFCQLSSKYGLYLDGKNPNIFNPAMHAGCLMDIGVYNLYIAAALFGRPKKIISDSLFLPSGADSCGTAILKYDDLNVNLIYSKVGQNYAYSEIIGDKATVSIESLSQLTGIDRITKDVIYNIAAHDITRDEVMSGEAAFFRDAVKNGIKASEGYDFAKSTALLVREMCDEIRKQNNFPF